MIFLADFPPPVHGMSKVNQDVFNFLSSVESNIKVINTVPSKQNCLFGTRRWVFYKGGYSLGMLAKLFYVLMSAKHKSVYRPINGGVGQVYDVLYLMLCRMFRKRIYIHHHSFSYLNRKSLVFSLLSSLAGKRAVHVVLGDKMSSNLQQLYNVKEDNVRILSNSSFFRKNLEEDKGVDYGEIGEKKESLIIGHLANLSNDKGVGVFCQLCRKLDALGIQFRAKVAGPFHDEAAEKLIFSLIDNCPNASYLGPVYGQKKEDFFKSLDVFIFPSKYRNEAEPLVLYEAAEHGVFLMGTEAGCMRDSIKNLNGFSFPLSDEEAWVEKVVEYLKENINQVRSLDQRRARGKRFHQFYEESNKSLVRLAREMRDAEA
ncbi:glycosyltransferase family 4 protein [Halomonas sp. M4R1S46]|uniref:glycosyltransferase family 4 protein n=1 Tax=Halomonas sp. M4R1S46 TaxID=2982692 RepID=UPI0021E49E13|nr:glycosyltransferase family 4 protein [Halomonas sp. M4R1S46]UYG06056.1 glycosyltransferase family 4 protein [Halomonas sp. M4R1S46]